MIISLKELLKTRLSLTPLFISFIFIAIGYWFLQPDLAVCQEKTVYYLVDSDIYDDLQTEITQFIADVSQDTNSQSQVIISDENKTALEIRQTLANAFNSNNLWGAFLIGRITPAYIQYPGSDEQLSDHPYISYECPYTDEDTDGVFEAASNFSIIPACMPDIWLSRVYPSREGEAGINQIRSYLNKNHLLRNDSSYFNKEMFYHSSIGIAEEGNTYDDFNDIFSDLLMDHPLFSIEDLTISFDTGVYDQIDSFWDAFESNYEILNVNNHGAPTILEFKECDEINVCTAVDVSSVELADKSSHVKLIDLDSCSNGHFTTPNYFAGEALFSGDTLLVIANPEVTLYFSDNLEEKFRTNYYGLGLGFSFADLYSYIDPGHPRHFFGDPTIIFSQRDSNNAPELAINGTVITESVKYELDFGDVADDNSKSVTLSFSNQGESALNIYGRWIQHYVSYNEISSPSSTTGFVFSITEPSYLDHNFEEIIQAGESREFKFTFNPNANDDVPGQAEYKGVFKFMTNDPNIGSFQIVAIGDHVVSSDPPATGDPADPPATGGGGGGGGSGIFGNIDLSELTGYHLDWKEKDGTAVYMPVTDWIKALKGAQTHVEGFAPVLANYIRENFDALERKTKSDQDGFLSKTGTYLFPVLGKVAEIYLYAVDSHELMDNAYIKTTIPVKEFDSLEKQGAAVSLHVVE